MFYKACQTCTINKGKLLKILMLSWEYPPNLTGGLGRHVADLAPVLARLGVSVHIITPYPEPTPSPDYVDPNLVVHRINTSSVEDYSDIYDEARQTNPLLVAAAEKIWLDVGGFDVIHVHDWLVSFAAIALKAKFRCPIIATLHATEKGRWRSDYLYNVLSQSIDQAEQRLAAESWRVIACSNYMMAELERQLSLPPDKLDMIPNGIAQISLPHGDVEGKAAFRRLFAEPETPLIFSVGRLTYEKGQHVLVGAMPYILKSIPDAKLVLAGRGPVANHLSRIIDDMNIQDHVHFAGYITDEERNMFFSVADCAVFPSLYEPFGIVALEAMIMRCPVIVSDQGGFPEVVKHKKNGLLIYPDNSESVAWGVLQVLQQPNLAKQYVNNAFETATQKYNWLRIAKKTRQTYKRVIEERAESDW